MKYHSEKVFAGEYDVAFEHPSPVILDIGANCGAFALWARKKWPNSTVFCFEPAQVSFPYLCVNTQDDANIERHQVAVLPAELMLTKLYVGQSNQGEASFFRDLNQTQDSYELPKLLHPSLLPEHDILKLDTEGSEVLILLGLRTAKKLPPCILLEYHREIDRRNIDGILEEYDLVGGVIEAKGRGTLKYIRRQE
jgi:FkbM family methyltransferase